MTGQWCAMCNAWGSHDTGHHDTGGALKAGDMAVVQDTVDLNYEYLIGKRGRVEQVRGRQVTIALPGPTGSTTTIALAIEHLRPA